MKIIKLYQVSVFLLCCICLNACNKSGEETQTGSGNDSTIPSESTKGDVDSGTVDSLVLQVMELQKRCASLQDNCTNLSEEVNELSSKCDDIETSHLKSLLSLAVVLLIILAVVVLVLSNKVKKQLEEIGSQHTMSIDGIKWELSQASAKNQGNQASQYNKDIKALETRVWQLEKKLEGITSPAIQQQSTQGINETPKSVNGYFGAVVKTNPPYFSTHMNSLSDEARFSASITGNVASFEPLNINMLKSFEYMDCAVDFSGVQRSSAKKMIKIKNGRAECQGDKWVIVEKASVVLS